MLARVVSVDEEEGGTLVVQVNGQVLTTMNHLDYRTSSEEEAGSEVDLEFTCLHAEEESWEAIATANPKHEKRLVSTGYWSYRAFGEVVSVGPEGLVDCGICCLPAPRSTSDPRCLGEYIAFDITRLDAWRKSAA